MSPYIGPERRKAERIPVHCTYCRENGAPVVVLTVVSGEQISVQDVPPELAGPGDVCRLCPKCGKEKCVRVLQRAA